MKSYLTIICIFLSIQLLSAQEIIMDENPSVIYNKKKGPESKHYSHPYFAFGLFSNHDQKAGSEIKMPNSFGIMFGIRYKFRVLSFYALGIDGSYRYQKYCINNEALQEDNLNPFSANRESDRQMLGINSLGIEVYNRLKAGRGNNLGYYVDAGIRGEWNYSNKLVVTNKYDVSEYPAGKVKHTEQKLDYIKRTAINATGRIGFKKTIIYGNYRISDLITEAYSTPELPRLSVGLQRAF